MEPPELRNFYVAIQNLRDAMMHDLPLDVFQRVCLENYIALIQLTYVEWKRRNVEPSIRRDAA
jgi:hypothetical protein